MNNRFVQASRRRFLQLSVAGVLLPSAAAVAAEPVTRGGTLVACVVPEPSGLVAGLSISAPAVAISANIFDGLVTYEDVTYAPRPSLAERWEPSPDGKSITFHLRQDVLWHDGKPFTSADVQYSLMEVTKKIHPRGNATFANLIAVETPDAATATFRFSQPSPVIWKALDGSETQILPRHLYENTDVLANPWNAKPIGTGPFVFMEWVRGDHILLERNPHYWDKGKPYLDRVLFRIIPDAGARGAALENGDVHYAPISPVPLSDVARLRTLPQLIVDTAGYESVSPVYFLDFNLRHDVFHDVRVRRAIAHAIDRDTLAATAWYGLAKPATGPIPSYQTEFYTADTPQYPFDPRRAEQLLDEAGHFRGADGVRLTIDQLPLPYGEDYVRSAEFIRQALKRIGIQFTLRTFDLPTYLRIIYTDRSFDTKTEWYACFSDPQIGVQRRYWTEAIKKGTTSSNASGYSSPRMDAIMVAMQHEADPAKRRDIIHHLQQVAQEDIPSVNLLELAFFRVYSSRLRGINKGPYGAYGAGFKDVWIAPA